MDFPHGPGLVNFAFQTGSSGNHLVTTGSDGTVSIYNRQGHLQDRIVLQAWVCCMKIEFVRFILITHEWYIPSAFFTSILVRLCTGLAWDNEGDILSIITNSSPQVNANSNNKPIENTIRRMPIELIDFFMMVQTQTTLDYTLGHKYTTKTHRWHRLKRFAVVPFMVKIDTNSSGRFNPWQFGHLQSSNHKVSEANMQLPFELFRLIFNCFVKQAYTHPR